MSLPPNPETTTIALDVLAEPRRRYLLAALLEREDASAFDPPSMSIASLATEVAAIEHRCPIVTDEQCERTHVALVHAHVPRLVDIGVLSRTDDGETTVALADHPILEAEWVRTLLADQTGDAFPADEATLDRTLEALRKPRRRAVCAALARRRGSVPVSDLAAAVVAREGGDERRLVDVTEAECAPVATALVHEHLPALSDAGLLEYDDSARRAAIATDAPQWRADWAIEGPLAAAARARDASERRDDPEQSLTDGTATDGSEPAGGEDGTYGAVDTCWTINGRESVVDRGREIADGADEELFVMVPDGDLIGLTCLERWRAAAERGVDVYVGSRSPRVRDTVRSAVPDATVCEPQFDWLNFPIEAAHHGSVVFADREAAMLVTVDESRPDEEPRVGAITGDGRENALVSVVCEHLGPRLDRLTAASDARDGTPLPM